MRLVKRSLRLHVHSNLPSWNTISISGYHIREAGSTAAEEIALTLAMPSVRRGCQKAGLEVDDFAPHLRSSSPLT